MCCLLISCKFAGITCICFASFHLLIIVLSACKEAASWRLSLFTNSALLGGVGRDGQEPSLRPTTDSETVASSLPSVNDAAFSNNSSNAEIDSRTADASLVMKTHGEDALSRPPEHAEHAEQSIEVAAQNGQDYSIIDEDLPLLDTGQKGEKLQKPEARSPKQKPWFRSRQVMLTLAGYGMVSFWPAS